MEDKPTESETIVTEEPVSDPVAEFKKGKAKREAKRKEVKVITEYVPPPPETPPAPEPPSIDSIADRVVEMLSAKQAAEEKPKLKRAAPKKKEPASPPTPPPTKYFGWC